MAFPTSWKHLQQPSCMGVQYHSSPQEYYTSLSTNKNTLDVQCYTSPQDSLSTNNNNPLDYISSGLLQDYIEQMPIEGLAEWIALGSQNQLMNSSNIERSNIDWLNQASNYEYKDAQESIINPSSTISSTTLSDPPHIDQFSNYSFGKQALANYINDSLNDAPPQLILSNLLHNKPLEIEQKALDLQLIEQELAMYHNVGASTQFINEEMQSLAQGINQMNASSLLCDGGIAESNTINAPSSICRTTITNSCSAHKFSASNCSNLVPNEERGNAVVKREERENGDEIDHALSSWYSSMMLNSNTPLQLGGVRRETENKNSCREEGALCREEKERSGVGRKRENKYIDDERETTREIGDEREESMRRYNGSLVEVKREVGLREQGRKRGRGTYVCKRRAGGGNSEEEEEVILVRARRGQATDSHSLAERVRRERISQRMKLLQELVPSCTKVLGKAAVLEEIINYVKSLQQQIEFLSMRLATTDYQKRFQI